MLPLGATPRSLPGPAVVDGEIREIKLRDYRGKYVVLFFYPKVRALYW